MGTFLVRDLHPGVIDELYSPNYHNTREKPHIYVALGSRDSRQLGVYRARHKAWAGLGLGLEKCQARQASQARAWIYMAKSVPMAQSAHGISAWEAPVPINAELYGANLSFG
ncbi:hypothetical protein B0H16DRAFT_1469643 [Mycena metata]|uniref:Uncharacterized protein n=1 Tax=Mycena metata TaxID=1033252 RepID=A0AAD7HX64_9AGAR|nr:hypothetical protein B0H16DRAFT_1469643 [Mycena metata]